MATSAPIAFFPRVSFTITPHILLSKPLAAFPSNPRRYNGQQWNRNEYSRTDYDQFSERN